MSSAACSDPLPTRAGRLVVIEGMPGAGKTTACEALDSPGCFSLAVGRPPSGSFGRLERAGLIAVAHEDAAADSERKVYEVTAAGRERLTAWVVEASWPRVAPTEFHLRLAAVAAARLADPVTVIDRQRRELLRQLRATQQAQLDEPEGSRPALLLEGAALRLQADLRWLEACTRHWTTTPPSEGSET